MSRVCGLRQISKEDAQLFLRSPEKFIELELADYETRKSRGFEEVIDHTRQSYDWHVLGALVSGSTAWTLLFKSGQQIGETGQMWQVLNGDAKVLSVSQVQGLNEALKELLAEEDEQASMDLVAAEQAGKPLYIPSTAPAEEWVFYDAGPGEHGSQWRNMGPSQAEIDLTLYSLLKQLQQFVQIAVEAKNALLITA